MKRRLLALALVLAMALSLAPAVFAEDTRETDFFTDRWHADTDFSDMEYESVDVAALKARFDELRALAASADNAEAVRAGVEEALDAYCLADTMSSLAYIYSSQDYSDVAAAERNEQADMALTQVWDAVLLLLRDILLSPCAAVLDEFLTPEDQEKMREYEGLSEESFALSEREGALVSEYWRLAGEEYSAEYNGKTWTDASAGEAYDEGALSDDEYTQIVRAVAKAKNEVVGAHFMTMLDLRNRISENEGYDNYVDYAYENIFQRDYTKEEIRDFHAAVKEEIVPVYQGLNEIVAGLTPASVLYEDYAGDIALDLMEPHVSALSSEMYESFRYMREHGLYDSGWNEKKTEQGYVTGLPYYGAAFFFNAPEGGFWDLKTAIHEFGHYNNDYWTDPGLFLGGKSTDLAEVHSQALELLFTHFYPELFGGAAYIAELNLLSNLASTVVDGCLYDELQQYAYLTPGVTLQQINEKYCQLCREYGLIEDDDPRTEMYGWVDIPHTFEVPMYYIAYAVSAAGAFGFWLRSVNGDYYDAVDDYLRFTALDLSYSFQDSFEAVGMEVPLSADYLQRLADALTDEVERLCTMPYADVTEDDWYYIYVNLVWTMALMDGESYTLFAPDAPLTRGAAVSALYRLAGSAADDFAPAGAFSDVAPGSAYEDAVLWAKGMGIAEGYGDGTFRPGEPVTREQFAYMLYRVVENLGLGFEGLWMFLLDNPDADQIAEYADEAMHWMVANSVMQGRDGNYLAPRDTATRAEGATIIGNFLIAVLLSAFDAAG